MTHENRKHRVLGAAHVSKKAKELADKLYRGIWTAEEAKILDGIGDENDATMRELFAALKVDADAKAKADAKWGTDFVQEARQKVALMDAAAFKAWVKKQIEGA